MVVRQRDALGGDGGGRGRWDVLEDGERHVKSDQGRDEGAGLCVLGAETGLEVEKDGAAVGSVVDHGELVCELRLVLERGVEDEAA